MDVWNTQGSFLSATELWALFECSSIKYDEWALKQGYFSGPTGYGDESARVKFEKELKDRKEAIQRKIKEKKLGHDFDCS